MQILFAQNRCQNFLDKFSVSKNREYKYVSNWKGSNTERKCIISTEVGSKIPKCNDIFPEKYSIKQFKKWKLHSLAFLTFHWHPNFYIYNKNSIIRIQECAIHTEAYITYSERFAILKVVDMGYLSH